MLPFLLGVVVGLSGIISIITIITLFVFLFCVQQTPEALTKHLKFNTRSDTTGVTCFELKQ